MDERRERHKKEEQVGQKGRTVAKHCVFPMFWGSGGSKSRLAKAAGAEPSGEMRDELHAVVARSARPSQNGKRQKHLILGAAFLEAGTLKKSIALWQGAHFEVKMVKAPHVRITLGS